MLSFNMAKGMSEETGEEGHSWNILVQTCIIMTEYNNRNVCMSLDA